MLMADLCLDEYTDHGHCGLLTPAGEVDNDATLERYASIAVAQAAAGAHVVAPSGMMDGQVAAIRAALDQAGYRRGRPSAPTRPSTPPRSTGRSATRPSARRSSATGPPTSRTRAAGEALREILLDVAEGADIVMVKPALPYLDVIAEAAANVPVPVAAYQVSGEYAMVEAAAANGWVDRDRVIMETVTAIRRAGAEHHPHLLGGRAGPPSELTGLGTRGTCVTAAQCRGPGRWVGFHSATCRHLPGSRPARSVAGPPSSVRESANTAVAGSGA